MPVPVQTGCRGSAPTHLGGKRGGWLTRSPSFFTPGKKLSYPLQRRHGGPHSGRDRCGEEKNHFFPPGFKPQTIQPVASHCTNCAISALPDDDDNHHHCHHHLHCQCGHCHLHYHQVPVLLKVSCVILSNDTAVSSETLQFIAAIFWYFVQN